MNSIINSIAEVNNTTLYYEVVGDGEPIVFVHGNFGDRRHWDFQFPSLGIDNKIIRYDVRGYGKSALPKSTEPYYDIEDLQALLEYLEIEKAHICGVSMGSGIVVDFALVYPENCISLISVGPWAVGYGTGEYESPAADSLFTVMANTASIAEKKGSREATDYFWTGNDVMAKSANISNSTLDALLQMGYEYSYWGFLNSNKRSDISPPAIGRLKEIKMPALIVTAEYDLEVCKEIADIMEKEIEGSVKFSVKDGGHLMNMDRPDEFNRLITEFINDLKE